MGSVGNAIGKAVNTVVDPIKNVVTDPAHANFGDFAGTLFPGAGIGAGGPAGFIGGTQNALNNVIPGNPVTDPLKNVLNDPSKANFGDYMGTLFPGSHIGFGGPAGVIGGITQGLPDLANALGGAFGGAGGAGGGQVAGPGQYQYSKSTLSEDDIKQQYQQLLGRDPSKAEMDQFKQYGDTGGVNLTAQDIGKIIYSTPEYQNKALSQYGQQYSDQLGQNDSRILGMAGDKITQQLAQQGRNSGGSTFTNAFAQAGANLAASRQQQLAPFYAQGYQNIMGNANQSGLNSQNFAAQQLQETQDFNRSQYGYQQQRSDYFNALNQQNQANRQGALIGGIGTILGAGAGGLISGNVAGAQPGAGIGGRVGQMAAPVPNHSGVGSYYTPFK